MSTGPVDSRPSEIEDVLRSFPQVLDALQSSYAVLSERAERVELELKVANIALEAKVRELDDLQRHLSAVLDSLPCGVLERDERGCIVRANPAARRLLALGDDVPEHVPLPPDRCAGDPFEYERPDGRRAVLASQCSEVRDQFGDVLGEVEILDDRTTRTELEQRLRATDKMVALGTMAGGIAHEIRNPLNAIKGFAGLLAQRDTTDAKALEWAEYIVQATSKANATIESILSFGDPERLVSEPLDGRKLLDDVARILREEFSGRAFVAHYESTAPPFRGDDMKLRHALRNLAANGLQVQEGKAEIAVNLFLDRDEIVARVDDAGPGIDAELRRRMLDPFFTTRAEGTGMGMTLVDTIARLHGGHVHIHSDPSPLGGARIDLRIPYTPPHGSTTPHLRQAQ